MSWRDAPLYVRSQDLARWILERVLSWPDAAQQVLGAPLAQSAQSLVCAVARALTFPLERTRHLQVADHAIIDTRIRLRLARDAGLLSAGGHRYAAGELLAIGRMLGGWKKRHARRTIPPDSEVSDSPF